MDILLKHWLPIVLFLLPSAVTAVTFLLLGRKKRNETKKSRILSGTLTGLTVLSGGALSVFLLSVGGGIELILPLLLLSLLAVLL